MALMTGLSYERLNWIHRWIARCLFLTATLHMAYFLKDWDRFDYIKRKLQIDIISRRGLGAWCVLLWIIVSSFGPIRNIRYEFFAIQHFVSLVGFITMIMLHTPSYAHKWIWVPVAICLVERTVRALYFIYNNLAIFHPTKKNVSHTSNGLISCKATFTPLAGRATHVLIQNPPFTWSPGQHVQLACPTLLPFQIHPFTIASLPSDNKLELIIRAHRGATGRIAKHANTRLPPVEETLVVLDGPYGRIRPLEQFDTVVLIAGSTGATFTMPLLRDLVRRWDLVRRGEAQGLATRRVKFVWVIKNRSQVGWFAEELRHVYQCLNEEASRERTTVKLSLAVNLYVTCDDVIQLLTTGAGANLGSKGETKSGAVSVTEIEHAPKEVGDTKSISGSVGGDSSSTEKDNCEEEVCCCEETATIADEDAIVPMSGNGSGSGSTTTTTTLRRKRCACRNTFPPTPEGKDDAEEFTTIQHSLGIPEEIHVLSGRPAIRLLINKELERARGESAVVACGPAGLVGYVRESVVGLSDERAACKGTGAQGVSLNLLCFVCMVWLYRELTCSCVLADLLAYGGVWVVNVENSFHSKVSVLLNIPPPSPTHTHTNKG